MAWGAVKKPAKGYIEALAARPVVRTEVATEKPARKSRVSLTAAAQAEEPTEAVELSEPMSAQAKDEVAWQKFRSGKGYTSETVAMLMYEFIQSRGLFGDLVKFVNRRK